MDTIGGTCDICGDTCEATQELNALTCTFAQCGAQVYHQDCLEKFLKSIKCEKNRKTGFQCPRGRGKMPGDQCPGRIDKSHPIHPRNDANKKRKKVKVVEPVPAAPRYGPAAKAARQKEKDEKDKALALAAKQEAAQKAANAKAAAAAKAKQQPTVDLNKQRAAAKALRREIMGVSPLSPTSNHQPEPAVRELKTFDEYEATKGAATSASSVSVAAPSFNAWAAKGEKQASEKPSAPLHFQQAFPAMPGGAKAKAKDATPLPSKQTQEHAPPSGSGLPARAPQSAPERERDNDAPSSNNSTHSRFWASQTAFQPPPPPPQAQNGHQSAANSDLYYAGTMSSLSNGLPPGQRPHTSPMHMSICASSLSSQHSTSSLQSSLLQAEGNGGALVGAVYADAHEMDQKLTKAQKKNLKRAEKKARQGNGSQAANDSSEADERGGQRSRPGTASSGPSPSPLLQACLAALARFKMLCCLHDLTNMGFPQALCVAAIQRTGTDMSAAIEWIVDHSSLGDEPLELGDYEGPAMLVDVSVEMAAIEEALALLSLTPSVIHQAVVECHGNLHEALGNVLQLTTRMLSYGDGARGVVWRGDAGGAWGPLNGKAAGAGGASRGVDEIPEAALMAAAAIAHDSDATVNHADPSFGAWMAALG